MVHCSSWRPSGAPCDGQSLTFLPLVGWELLLVPPQITVSQYEQITTFGPSLSLTTPHGPSSKWHCPQSLQNREPVSPLRACPPRRLCGQGRDVGVSAREGPERQARPPHWQESSPWMKVPPRTAGKGDDQSNGIGCGGGKCDINAVKVSPAPVCSEPPSPAWTAAWPCHHCAGALGGVRLRGRVPKFSVAALSQERGLAKRGT